MNAIPLPMLRDFRICRRASERAGESAIRRLRAVWFVWFSVLFCALPIRAWGDYIVKNDGTKLEGQIVKMDENTVTIDITGYATVSFPREQIQVIHKDRDVPVDPFVGTLDLVQKGEPVAAVERLFEEFRALPGASPDAKRAKEVFDATYGKARAFLRDLFRSAESLASSAEGADEGTTKTLIFAAAKKTYEKAVGQFNLLRQVDADFLRLMMGGERYESEHRRGLDKELAQCHLSFGKALWASQSPSCYAQAETEIQAAVDVGLNDPSAYFLLGKIQAREANLLRDTVLTRQGEARRLEDQAGVIEKAVQSNPQSPAYDRQRVEELRRNASDSLRAAAAAEQDIGQYLTNAKKNLAKAEAETTDSDVRTQARQIIAEVGNTLRSQAEKEEAARRQQAAAAQTPTTPPAPAPASASPVSAPASASPAPAPATPSPPASSTVARPPAAPAPAMPVTFADAKRQFMRTFQKSGLPAALKEVADYTDLPTVGMGLGAGIAVIAVFWAAPRRWLKRRARSGDIRAAQWLTAVRWFGLLALVGFLIGGIKMPARSKTRKRCPYCNRPVDDIEDYSGLDFYVCPHCQESIAPVYGIEDYVDHLVKQIDVSKRRKRLGGKIDVIERDAMGKLVRSIVSLAVRKRASDLHVEPHENDALIRYRTDGMLHEMLSLPSAVMIPFISTIKVLSNLDIAENRVPQDGKFSLYVDKVNFDVRVSTAPSTFGQKATLRLLDPRSIEMTLEGLGLEGDNLHKFNETISRPDGLIVVTGPTGSGKTTSLYVLLRRVNTGEKSIVAIEDPVEYNLKGVSQMQVNLAQGFTFVKGLRSALRSDPDVIMIGEIRDSETAQIAIDAAVTGHLVLTTLHTISAAGVFPRLHELGVKASRYSVALTSIIAQRLVRKVCPECRRPYRPDVGHLAKVGLDVAGREILFYQGSGCQHCDQTGYFGRVGLFEILMLNNAIRGFLETDPGVSAITEVARKEAGMRTLREEGVVRILQGVTTVEEVLRVTT